MHRLRLPRTHRHRTRSRGTRTTRHVSLGRSGPHAAAPPLRETQPSVSSRLPETPARDEEQASAGVDSTVASRREPRLDARACARLDRVRTIARNRRYSAKHRFSPDCRNWPLKGPIRPGPSLRRFSKDRDLQDFESGRQDLNLRPPGPQPEGSGCVGADQPSRAGSSCPELVSVALSLDPGLDPVGTGARSAPAAAAVPHRRVRAQLRRRVRPSTLPLAPRPERAPPRLDCAHLRARKEEPAAG
jgi:hypothetical protein